MKHLNPRQGITNVVRAVECVRNVAIGVKHLNPRQGITNHLRRLSFKLGKIFSVKHLNPRQGITNFFRRVLDRAQIVDECETPKSPPGDYK